ncbi:uncharacterized protein LOC130531637 isoform X1 [Takifugu flavidus]|uniref:uncharacterized protein LOC130531637 isoform X1 n=1 Tax=Takifugu flavidus TaxID=433684 RepID=UPI0025442433|nr:uncharacterized protein LOC130531637 isoform X1 [Takifugu flavidus]
MIHQRGVGFLFSKYVISMLGKPQEEGVSGLPNILNATHPASDQNSPRLRDAAVGRGLILALTNRSRKFLFFLYAAMILQSEKVEWLLRIFEKLFLMFFISRVAGKEYVVTRGTTEDTWTGFASRNSLRACLLKDLEYPLVERARNSVLVASMKSPWLSMSRVNKNELEGTCNLETFWMKSAARRNDVRPAPLGRILMDFRE